MRFVFDPLKELTNIRKHGLDFGIAQAVFDDLLGVTIFDRNEQGEDRYWQVGTAGGNFRLLVVVFSHPDALNEDIVRIISVRAATKMERKDYEANFD